MGEVVILEDISFLVANSFLLILRVWQKVPPSPVRESWDES